MKRVPLSPAVARPMLWGLAQGYSVRAVARGLAIRESTVVQAVFKFGPAWLALQLRRDWQDRRQLDAARLDNDPRYRNWFRAATGAACQLDALGEM